MATSDIAVGSAVMFLDSGKKESKAGTVALLRDHFHIDITLTAGGTLTNVPHVTQNPYIGWYGLSSPAAEIPVQTLSSGTTKHRIQG